MKPRGALGFIFWLQGILNQIFNLRRGANLSLHSLACAVHSGFNPLVGRSPDTKFTETLCE